jgi:putative oxidoreductase
MKDLTLLLLRATVGGLLAGHGARELRGRFGGPGLAATSDQMERLDLSPGYLWALLEGTSQFWSGMFTVLGLMNPLGPIGIAANMIVATTKVHWGKPIWVEEGGAELPITNIAMVTAVASLGPGRYSLDSVLGLRTPRWMTLLALTSAIVGIAATLRTGLGTPQPSDEMAR